MSSLLFYLPFLGLFLPGLSTQHVYSWCPMEPPPFFSRGVPSLWMTECCNISVIPTENVVIDYNVVATGNTLIPWRLDATVKWNPPTLYDGYTYSVALNPTVPLDKLEDSKDYKIQMIISDKDSCTAAELRMYDGDTTCPKSGIFSTVVEETQATFTDLIFGFPYKFLIQVIKNESIAAEHTCFSNENDITNPSHDRVLIAPDCFRTTNDLEFCEKQPVIFSSEPRNISIVIEDNEDTSIALLHLKWEEPLLINEELYGFSFLAVKVLNSTEKRKIIFSKPKIPASDFEVSTGHYAFTINSTNVGNIEGGFVKGFTYEVLIIPFVIPPSRLVGLSTNPEQGNIGRITLVWNVTEFTMTTNGPITVDNKMTTLGVSSDVTQYELLYIIGGALLGSVALFVLLGVTRYCLMTHKDETIETWNPDLPLHKPKSDFVSPEFLEKEILNPDNVILDQPIGSGQYGKVFKAYLKAYKDTGDQMVVAVKTTKDHLPDGFKDEFLDEIRLMLDIGDHPNIMPVIGCCTVIEPYYLITEFMQYGSLKDFLNKCEDPHQWKADSNYNLTKLAMLKIAHQVATGMAYLATTRYFHGDLAARNILIGTDMAVKISDFGLSNDIYARGYVRLPAEHKRPVKWYSPEANLYGRCSPEGDVWSYGVLLYELYSLGKEPYTGMTPREVIVRVNKGYRMEKPDNCPQEMYNIMLDCWQHEPSSRPKFDGMILKKIEELLTRNDDYFIPDGNIEEQDLENAVESSNNEINRTHSNASDTSFQTISENMEVTMDGENVHYLDEQDHNEETEPRYCSQLL